jgi:hypothetical protein
MGRLDPVALDELAAHLRDETWLDLRVVEVGTVERAQVNAIIVRRDFEEIELRQEHMFDGVVTEANMTVSADAIFWARPTCFELIDVEIAKPKRPSEVDDKKVINAVKDLLVFLYKNDKRTPLESRAAVERMLKTNGHTFIWLIMRYGSGELDNLDVCKMAGYKSPMPWQSAKWKFNRDDNKNLRKNLDKLMQARGFSPPADA